MTGNENCDHCVKLKDYTTANKMLVKHRDELECEVETLRAQIESLHTQNANRRLTTSNPKTQAEPSWCGTQTKGHVKISRSTAYEIYAKYGREPVSLPSDKSCTS